MTQTLVSIQVRLKSEVMVLIRIVMEVTLRVLSHTIMMVTLMAMAILIVQQSLIVNPQDTSQTIPTVMTLTAVFIQEL